MAEYGFSQEIKKLIASQLPTMDHVEILVLLQKIAPAALTQADIVRESKRPLELVAKALSDLAAGGIVTHAGSGGTEDSYRYDPQSAHLRAAADELVKEYDTRPVTLIRAIYDRPPDPVMSFAEAFRIRGGDK
jgi:hypothetical protein